MSDKIITFGSHSRTSANLVDRPLLIDESQSLLSSSHVHDEATLPVEAKKTAGLCHKIGLGILIGLATIIVVPGLIWLGVHLYQRHLEAGVGSSTGNQPGVNPLDSAVRSAAQRSLHNTSPLVDPVKKVEGKPFHPISDAHPVLKPLVEFSKSRELEAEKIIQIKKSFISQSYHSKVGFHEFFRAHAGNFNPFGEEELKDLKLSARLISDVSVQAGSLTVQKNIGKGFMPENVDVEEEFVDVVATYSITTGYSAKIIAQIQVLQQISYSDNQFGYRRQVFLA